MKKKNLTLIFKHFEEEHLGKETFLVPYYLGKLNNLNVTIVCPDTESNRKLGDNIQGVNIVRIKSKKNISQSPYFFLNTKILIYLLKNATKINYLMSIHCRWQVLLMLFIYKVINLSGKTYLRGDGGGTILYIDKKPFFKRTLFYFLLNRVNFVSVEEKQLYDEIIKSGLLNGKIYHIPNGFNEDMLAELNMKVKDFSEKENLIITVSRLGTFQKNTEMILRAISKIDFRGWKIILIGPIEKKEQNFQLKIDQFYIENPNLKNKVIFTGPIFNKAELWQYYNRSKIFLLTSRSESYANVYAEAYQFSNYIITTDVGGARDTISNGYGKIFTNDKEFQNILQDIIDNKVDLKSLYESCPRKSRSWESFLKVLPLK